MEKAERPPLPSWCPRCKKVGTRITNSYEVQGVTIPDDYCGWCGRNWPKDKGTT